MLVNPGDLIPVTRQAINIPWTKRKSQILNYLHRGPVTFKTYVYDTNVGDISPLSTYFNPERWNDNDLNHKFGQVSLLSPSQSLMCIQNPNFSSTVSSSCKDSQSTSVIPKLLLYSSTSVETPPKESSFSVKSPEFNFDDVFSSRSSSSSLTNSFLVYESLTVPQPLEIQKPSIIWRLGSSASTYEYSEDNGPLSHSSKLWNWNSPLETKSSAASSTSSEWQPVSSYGWSSAPTRDSWSSSFLSRQNETILCNDIKLAGSLLHNLTNFNRNETLV